MKKLFVLIAALVLVTTTAMATPVDLSTFIGPLPDADGKLTYDELVALGSGTLGDKLFSNFAYSSSSSGGATAIPSSGVTVTPITTPLDPGFQFNAAWSVTPGQTLDSLISFDVQALSGGNAIDDIFASIGGYGYYSNGSLSVGVTTTPGNLYLLDNSGAVVDHETITFNATTGVIHVVKDISLNGNSTGDASVSQVIDQFSEVPSVPEPATMLLLGSGLIGLAGFARRKFKK